MAKPKIKIGEPYTVGNALCVPVRFSFPNGTFEEEIINWNRNVDPDEVERQLKTIYMSKWSGKTKPIQDKILKLKNKEFLKVTSFDDEPELKDDPVA